MAARDEFRSGRFGRQLVLFKKMLYGNITPTDIDGFMEFRDSLFIFFEVKFHNKELPKGQRLSLERLVRRVGKTCPAYLMVGTHNVAHRNDVTLYDCNLTEMYMARPNVMPHYHKIRSQIIIGDAVTALLHIHNLDYLTDRTG